MKCLRMLAAAAVLGCALNGAAQTGFSCLTPPTITSALPSDVVVGDQDDFNCFAWQEFIALNWKASGSQPGQPDTTAPASAFGAPSSAGTPPPAVWETYALDSDVFRPGGAPPQSFVPRAPPATTGAAATDRFARSARVSGYKYLAAPHVLRSVAKVSPRVSSSAAELSELFQAFTHAWLTAQNGQLTYYEVRLNQDEYTYIVQNKLYDANCQQAAGQSGTGIHLPDGSAGGVGAIEVKAAWLPLTDPSLYAKYLTAPAVVIDPATSQPRQVIVGLVGLHIIRKTKNAQQFAWATFEHVANAPDSGATGGGPFTYYNTSCNPTTDPYQCAVNTQPPACTAASCAYSAPMQVVRHNPLPKNVAALNQYAAAQIRAANPTSVFQYYQLVNVMWPMRNTPITGAPIAPLTDGNSQPPASLGGLANVTLETYFQSSSSLSPNKAVSQPACLACHTVASISSRATGATTPYASDYSFLFGEASASAPPVSCPQTEKRSDQRRRQ